MRYAAWYAFMHTPDKDGKTQYASAKRRAAQGAEWAIKQLAGPKFPESLRYLWNLFLRLRRGLRRDFDTGLRVCTWTDMRAFAKSARVRPHEQDALFVILDAFDDPKPHLEGLI